MAKLKLIDTKDRFLLEIDGTEISLCYKLSDNTNGRRCCTAHTVTQRS